jgi:ribonuclease HI
MGRPNIELWQGLARYSDNENLENRVSLDGKSLGEAVKIYSMKTIEDWKIDRIPQFTLALPGAKDKMAMCRRTKDVSGLQKVADIYREQKTTKLKFYKICEHFSEFSCNGTPIGYLAITNQKGVITTYEFSLETVPMMANPEGVIAFVDGSGGGRKTVFQNGVTYTLYGGAYLLFHPGNSTPFSTSEADENDPIPNGLMGITAGVGNVYAEINSAIMAIRRADSLGYQHLRLYYDCEQIGGHAPEGAFKKHDTKISKKYVEFLDAYAFASLKTIELVHVDGHVGVQPNEDVDQAAKRIRDAVADEFEADLQKRALYLEHAEDYNS